MVCGMATLVVGNCENHTTDLMEYRTRILLLASWECYSVDIHLWQVAV